MRIAIAGSGIGGLALASILSRRAPALSVSLFERSARHGDQGYGLDLDEHGQLALARSGLLDRLWDVSREHSDSAVVYSAISGGRGAQSAAKRSPLATIFRPRALQQRFPSFLHAAPETSRDLLRSTLLDAVEDRGVHVQFGCGVHGVTVDAQGRGQVWTESGDSLGDFDVVIDASGVHSPLRLLRVEDEDGGRTFKGEVMVHGAIESPEETASADLLDALGTFGSIVVLQHGYRFILQRYGAAEADGRLAFFYVVDADREDAVVEQMGLPKAASRAEGILRGEAELERVAKWLQRDMGDAFDGIWHEAVALLTRASVRPIYQHGKTTLAQERRVPLVCMGDALRHCGLGGGGNLAMQDALDVAAVLEDSAARGSVDWKGMRAAEERMLVRKDKFHADQDRWGKGGPISKRNAAKAVHGITLADVVPSAIARHVASAGLGLLRWQYGREMRKYGLVGSTRDSPLHPAAVAEQKKQSAV